MSDTYTIEMEGDLEQFKRVIENARENSLMSEEAVSDNLLFAIALGWYSLCFTDPELRGRAICFIGSLIRSSEDHTRNEQKKQREDDIRRN